MTNPFNVGYYTEHDLRDAGFKSLGRNVRIARNCTIMGLENIEIGNDVRIDGYCTLMASGASASLKLGSHIHIASYVLLSAGDGIDLHDFVGVSQACRIYSRSDDYSGEHLTGPTIPSKYLGVHRAPVTIGRHGIIGTGTVILPGVTIGEGSSVGANSLVSKDLEAWGVYFGSPAKRLKSRSRKLLELEEQLKLDEAAQSDGH